MIIQIVIFSLFTIISFIVAFTVITLFFAEQFVVLSRFFSAVLGVFAGSVIFTSVMLFDELDAAQYKEIQGVYAETRSDKVKQTIKVAMSDGKVTCLEDYHLTVLKFIESKKDAKQEQKLSDIKARNELEHKIISD